MALDPADAARYVKIIDDILATSDLNTVSAKAVRKDLQARVERDLAPQKKAITDLIHQRFDRINDPEDAPAEPVKAAPAPAPAAPAPPSLSLPPVAMKPSPPAVNGNGVYANSARKRSPSVMDDDEPRYATDLNGSMVSRPAKKKKPPPAVSEDDDAAFAAKLQAEEDRRAGRATRQGPNVKKRNNTKKGSPEKAKRKKKKSAARLSGDDDSDLEGSERPERKVNRNSGFHKPMVLSAPLSQLLGGETQMSRPQCVKKIWEYVKARDLQDPADKRQIRCDDAMRAVFKSDRVHMFTMNKILASNLYAVDE